MRFILKIAIGVLNLIFAVLKLLPVQNKVTFISRQADSKSEDMELLERELSKQDFLERKCSDKELSPARKQTGQNSVVKMVFLCKKLENGTVHKICYCLHVLRQMYHIATSRVVVLDSYCIAVSVLKQRPSLTVIQMWHALGALKKFGLSIVGEEEGSSLALADSMAMHKHYTYVLTSSRACAPYFGEAFGYGREALKVMSLPRVDKLTDKAFGAETAERVRRRYPEFKDKKVVVYAPTFRKGKDISAQIDRLAGEFDGEEYVFVLKKHPLMEETCSRCLVDEEFSTLEMLFAADYVICDYSAVIFEAAILEKPLFFYAFDYDRYGVARDFYIDYMKEMPGVVSKDPKALAEAVKLGRCDMEKVRAFSRKYVENQQGCAKELARFIMELAQ